MQMCYDKNFRLNLNLKQENIYQGADPEPTVQDTVNIFSSGKIRVIK